MSLFFNILGVNPEKYGGAGTGAFSARRQDLPWAWPQNRVFRLPDGNAAYIKEWLHRFRSADIAVLEPVESRPRKRAPRCTQSFLIAGQAFDGSRGRISDLNHAQQSRSRRPAAGYKSGRRHVRRRRLLGDGCAVEVRGL